MVVARPLAQAGISKRLELEASRPSQEKGKKDKKEDRKKECKTQNEENPSAGQKTRAEGNQPRPGAPKGLASRIALRPSLH